MSITCIVLFQTFIGPFRSIFYEETVLLKIKILLKRKILFNFNAIIAGLVP